MTNAKAAGLRVGVKIMPLYDGGFSVYADVQRPLGRAVPTPPPAPESQVVRTGVKVPLKTPTLAAFCEASPEARAVAVAQAVETYSGAACAAIEAMRPELIKLAEAARKDRAEDFNAVLLSIDAAIKPIDRATPPHPLP
jgi:hypothetical protein